MRTVVSVVAASLIASSAVALSSVTDVGAVTDPLATVFISEIHYDNASTDAGEAVEVFGPAGTDLSGWSIVLYNGANGQAYRTDALSGLIPDEDGTGYGAVSTSYPVNGIQNGDPDGLALVNGSTVVQFLSYETTAATPILVASDGVAAGLSATNLPVSENGSEPIGGSLALAGTGATYGALTWTKQGTHSFGSIGLIMPTAPPIPPVRISEIHYDNVGADTGEAIEVTGPAGVDLAGWSLELHNGAAAPGDTEYDTVGLGGVLLDEVGGLGAAAISIPGIQNGPTDGVALVEPGGMVVEFLSYGGSFIAVGGAADGLTSTDIGVAEGATTPVGFSLQLLNGAWTGPVASSFGLVNFVPRNCPLATEITPIHVAQGAGAVTPCAGEEITVEAIVTSLFTNQDAPDGFFVQEEDADADASDATSEGLFVFCRGACPDPSVAPGDLVRVRGPVVEFFGMTQIDARAFLNGSITTLSSGNPRPAAATETLPAAGSTRAEATFEPHEGMVVTFPGTLVVSEYFELARYGQLVLTADAQPFQFTHDAAPSVAGYQAFLADLATRRIILDDDNNDQNDGVIGPVDEAYPWPAGGLSTLNRVRGGDTIAGLTGVLHWSFAGQGGTDAWRIRPIAGEDYTFTAANPAPASPEDVGGDLKVASFNVLNYFTTIDTTPSNNTGPCGPNLDQDCRGADSAAELARQRDKIVSAIATIDADVVGLIEIENDEDQSVHDLVDALNATTAAGTYASIDTGFIGTDAIKVAFIYQPASITPVGDYAILDSSIDPNFLDTENRPALIQTFEQVGTSERFTAAINHLKSKGSDCNALLDPDLGDGQANCPVTRTRAAQALADYLATDPTGSGDPDQLILGDLNSYRMEAPIAALEAAGYTDLLEHFVGDDAYTYLFDGQLGYLDYALANDSLLGQVTGTTGWAINADEIPLFDYNDDVQDAGEASFERESTALPIYAPDALRASDHDPVIVGLDLDSVAENVLTIDDALIVTERNGGGTVILAGSAEGTFTACPRLDLRIDGFQVVDVATKRVGRTTICLSLTSTGLLTFDYRSGAFAAVLALPKSFTLADNTVEFALAIDGAEYVTERTGRRIGLIWIAD
jgi:predicted extracellular nuclease